MGAALAIVALVGAGALVLVRHAAASRADHPTTSPNNAGPRPVVDSPPPAAKAAGPRSPARELNATVSAVRSRPGAALPAPTPGDETNHASASLADVVGAHSLPGYQSYKQSALLAMGWSSDYASGAYVVAQTAAGVNPQFAGWRLDNEALALKQLGLDVPTLKLIASQMSDDEWVDFWVLGVVPSRFAPNTQGTDRIGGWKSPYVEAVANYGTDGGMWNAVLSFWKTGAQTVVGLIPVVGAVGAAALGQVKIETKGNKQGALTGPKFGGGR